MTSLLDKNFNDAWFYFVESENASNGYNQSYEISNYLKSKEKANLKDVKFWLDIYSDILIKYNKFIEPKTKKELSKHFLNHSNLKNIRIYNLGLNSNKADKVFQKINSFYPNTTKKNLSKKPNWFAPEPSVLWYDEKSIPLATALKFIIEDELDIKVIVNRGGGLGVDMSNKLNELRIHLRE